MWRLLLYLLLTAQTISTHSNGHSMEKQKVMETPFYSKHVIEEQTKKALTPINIKSIDPLWQASVYKDMQSVDYKHPGDQQTVVSDKDRKYEDVVSSKAVKVDAIYLDDPQAKGIVGRSVGGRFVADNKAASIDDIVARMNQEVIRFQKDKARRKFLR